MTDISEPGEQVDAVDAAAGGQVDTTGGDRDPLTTDDGLADAAEQMPGVPEAPGFDDGPGLEPGNPTMVNGADGPTAGDEDPAQAGTPVLLDNPDLDVTKAGTDPCALLGAADTEVGS